MALAGEAPASGLMRFSITPNNDSLMLLIGELLASGNNRISLCIGAQA